MGGASSTTLGASSTAEDVLQSVGTARVAGKHVLITGGSGGLGLESARVLAKGGAKVTITTRSEEQGRATVEKLATLGAPGVSYEVLLLDDLESVKACATRILARQQPLHVLLNNAGVMACPRSVTKQGLETQFGVNHVGHFLLTTLLLPLLASSGTPECKARVVNVSSMGAYLYAPAEGLFWDDLDGTKVGALPPLLAMCGLGLTVAAAAARPGAVCQISPSSPPAPAPPPLIPSFPPHFGPGVQQVDPVRAGQALQRPVLPRAQRALLRAGRAGGELRPAPWGDTR